MREEGGGRGEGGREGERGAYIMSSHLFLLEPN